MRVFTSASAGKYIRQLEDEKEHLLSTEQDSCVYVLAQGEQSEPPAYDYADVRAQVDELDRIVRTVRHALHIFNATCTLPTSGMTIDEALIALAQMSNKSQRLGVMRRRQPKERLGSTVLFTKREAIEYRYANYDIAQAESDYRTLLRQIADLQLEIDLCNQTKTFEVDIEG